MGMSPRLRGRWIRWTRLVSVTCQSESQSRLASGDVGGEYECECDQKIMDGLGRDIQSALRYHR